MDITPPVISYLGKEEPCLSLADYVCGVFKDHYLNLKAINNFEKRDFKRIGGKIRVIHDYMNDIFYTRKNPFPR